MTLASFYPSFPKSSEPERRNAKILLDCSGSMAGDSIEAAKRALHAILSMLEPRDRFSLSRFGSSVQHFHKALQPVNGKTIGDAGRKVMSVEANGGTELAAALSSTLELDAGTRADILLITDGEVWQADAVVAAAQSSGQRIFVVGIGSAPAESVLRRLGEETGGACEFVAPNEDVEGAITRMFLRIAQEPASQVRTSWPGTVEWEVPPGQAIFDGETLHVFARTASMPSGRHGSDVSQRQGRRDNGQPGPTRKRHGGSSKARSFEEAFVGWKLRAARNRRPVPTHHGTHQLRPGPRGADAEKAKDLPELAQVRQMLAGDGADGSEATAQYNIGRCADVSSLYEKLEQPVRSAVAGTGHPSHSRGRPARIEAGNRHSKGLPAFSWASCPVAAAGCRS